MALTATGTVTVRYYAGARAAAGTASELAPATALTGLVAELADRHGEPLRRILSVSSFLVDGTAWHDPGVPLPVGAMVDVLPPFAGG